MTTAEKAREAWAAARPLIEARDGVGLGTAIITVEMDAALNALIADSGSASYATQSFTMHFSCGCIVHCINGDPIPDRCFKHYPAREET